MKSRRSLWAICFVALLISFGFFPSKDVNAQGNVNLLIKGELVEGSSTVIKNDRILVPLRTVVEKLGYEGGYDNKRKEVSIKNEQTQMLMNIGETKYKLNNRISTMDVAPVLIESKTYVPIRFVAESFGEKVYWDDINRVAIISEYGGSNISDVKTVEYVIGECKFKLNISDDFKKNIGVDVEDDSIRFYDIYNKEKSFDGSSGTLCFINRSKSLDFIVAPSIVLDFNSGNYVQAIFETGVEYSTENNLYKEKYDESLKLLKETLKTYKGSIL